MKLTLGFSPCPNDTFIFDAMVNGLIDTRGLEFDIVMEDVEQLNIWAADDKLDITKLSFRTFLDVVTQYALLHSGSALGKGVGPLLVSHGQVDIAGIDGMTIAIPGANTTANLLLSLAFPGARIKTEIRFDRIEQAVLDGVYDIGLIIHEGRFTYEKKGLNKVIDLGQWWEQKMYAPIPLGGIVAKRSLGPDVCAAVDAVIKDSLAYAWKRYPVLSEFISCNAQEMEEDVMRKHIDLYVNRYTTDLGPEGAKSIELMFAKAREGGLLTGAYNGPIFY